MEKQRKVIAKMVRSQTRKPNRFSLLNFWLLLASCERGEITLKMGKRRKSREQCGLRGLALMSTAKIKALRETSGTGVVREFCTQNFSINVSAQNCKSVDAHCVLICGCVQKYERTRIGFINSNTPSWGFHALLWGKCVSEGLKNCL